MTRTTNCTAVFAANPTLTVVITPNGGGTVTSVAGINCPGDCTETLQGVRMVTLTAAPASGWEFVQWTGDGECVLGGGNEQFTLTVFDNTTCTAEFYNPNGTPQDPLLVVYVEPSITAGTVTSNPAGITCGADCQQRYPDGMAVTLTAAPSPGYYFDHWERHCAGTDGPVAVVSTSSIEDRVCTAVFIAMPVITVAILPSNDAGTVTSSPAGISCPGDCSEQYANPNALIQLTAAPASGWRFLRWTSADLECTGVTNPVTTVLAWNGGTCTAEFEQVDACSDTPALTYNQPLSATLGGASCIDNTYYVDEYAVTVPQTGNRFTLSASINTFVKVTGPGGTVMDYGRSTAFPGAADWFFEPGDYRIAVSGTVTSGGGNYTMNLAPLSTVLDNCRTVRGMGTMTFAQALTTTDCAATSFYNVSSGSTRYDFIMYTPAVGRNVNVSMTATDFPPALLIIHYDFFGNIVALYQNGNSGNATSLSYDLTGQPGIFCIVFMSRGANNGAILGAYTASITQSP